ncbi:hypothetical protein Daus18300_013186 [Diaporthe australafricana]|uniref:F-box domain-containing protein n=1 Tax=Diaporthe australafricana TaxID=127596 RepID=A0ABR3W017_9PEZI
MFRVLRHRYQVNWEQRLRRFPIPNEYDDYWEPNFDFSLNQICIQSSGFRSTEGIERGYFSKECLREEHVTGNHYLRYDPLDIPALTSTILANLEPRIGSEHPQETSQLRKRLLKLPNEVKLLIFGYVAAAQDWPLLCTRILGPSFWKTLFNKYNPCFAWLWDLDEKMVHQTDPNLVLDWELLFRKLSQGPKVADCFGGHGEPEYEAFRGVLKHVPPGLEGRRRIWKLLDEMYVGDRSTRWELWLNQDWPAKYNVIQDMAEVPVYWGKNGQPLRDEELRELREL